MSYVNLGAPPAAQSTAQEKALREQEARRQLAAEVVKLTQKAAERIDYILSNEASLWSMMNTGLIWLPTVAEARQSLIRARKELFEKFRPIALAAIEDPSRNLSEIKTSIEGYLYSLEQQLKIVIQISESHNLTGAISAQFDRMISWVSEAAGKVSKSVQEAIDPTKSLLPWALAGAVGLLILIKR